LKQEARAEQTGWLQGCELECQNKAGVRTDYPRSRFLESRRSCEHNAKQIKMQIQVCSTPQVVRHRHGDVPAGTWLSILVREKHYWPDQFRTMKQVQVSARPTTGEEGRGSCGRKTREGIRDTFRFERTVRGTPYLDGERRMLLVRHHKRFGYSDKCQGNVGGERHKRGTPRGTRRRMPRHSLTVWVGRPTS
jgi:hypothetical protein